MTDELTPTQALALWGLLARQGRAAEKDVKAPDRAALAAAGFAEADRASRTVSLTDRGWRWASEHLAAPSLDKQPVLTLFFARLGEHLARSGGSLAEFIGEAPPLPEPEAKPIRAKRAAAPKAPKAEQNPRVEKAKAERKPKVAEEPKPKIVGEPKPKPARSPKAPPKPKPPTVPVLRTLIEEAYLRASGGARSEPVRLSRLRAELGDLDRRVVDAGLARIVKAKKETASLSQISDNKAIDEAERDAAYSPAGEPFHLIRIQ